ncbi:saccharopine dehydrogenase NADP-binding domain-containing protein [Streptomyces formicae]|uniref:Saccharopine dehydrogenase NADP-binding domain-containing protein n=1 Tax=Streptomyces formicae TaxID=1616117 RepID=A0ABY3WJM9_9ACTN|nr:saccharopine dehydrogenase NADP-binding domain-containing protein [Streptomyces formicae]UNM11816.1 saccharopine dehydrogenase NADP-binding domain-containing protein [Streptomyces formicae]
MALRIVLFGATGRIGRITARALVAAGVRPVLAGKDLGRLELLSAAIGGGADIAAADATRPESVRDLLGRGDVLITTVGPYTWLGAAAVEAAIDAGAVYMDCTGEPRFIRRIFDEYGPRAAASGASLLPAMGFDFVVGNAAGATAVERAGPDAVRLDVGYFFRGNVRRAMSPGSRASAVSMAFEPAHRYRSGRIAVSSGGSRRFPVGGTSRYAVPIGATEHFALPRAYPQLRDVNVCLGIEGAPMRAAGVVAAAGPALARVPGVRRGVRAAMGRMSRCHDRDPDAVVRIESLTVAQAFDSQRRLLSDVAFEGTDPHGFTGHALAGAAVAAARSGVRDVGALGPVSAFGRDWTVRLCAEHGYAEPAARQAR